MVRRGSETAFRSALENEMIWHIQHFTRWDELVIWNQIQACNYGEGSSEMSHLLDKQSGGGFYYHPEMKEYREE